MSANDHRTTSDIDPVWMLLAASASASAQAGDAKLRVDGAWARRATMLGGDAKAGSGNGAVHATLVNPGRSLTLSSAPRAKRAAAEIQRKLSGIGQ